MTKTSILLSAVLLVGPLLTACGREGPIPPPDRTPPQVNSTIPANGSVGVPVNLSGGITIHFSKEMDASTINDQTIALAEGQNSVPGLVTYTAGVSNAVFTPSSVLNPTTLYRLSVNEVKDAYGIPMDAPYICSFNTGTAPDTTSPYVVDTDTKPGNGSVNVQPNAPIIVDFSELVVPATISFVLSAGSSTVPCTMSYSGTNAIFAPSNVLAYGTQYTAMVNAGVRDLAGNTMQNDYIWSFTTTAASDTIPPVVMANTPSVGATGVAVNIAPSVMFSEPVDPTTITFTLSAGGSPVAGNMTYSGTIAIFTPSISLAYSTLYTATVSAGVRDLAGNAMPNGYLWSFVTGTALDMIPPSVTGTIPAVGATGVAVNLAPSVTFSEPVDPTTISFVLSAASSTVPCTMNYSGTTAVFKPSGAFKKNTLYTARVSAGVRDLAGNAMPNDYFWSFTTSKN